MQILFLFWSVTCRRNIYESMQRKFRSSMNMTQSKDNQQQNIEIYHLLVVVLLQQKMVKIVLVQRTFDCWIKFLQEYWVFNERLSLTELLSNIRNESISQRCFGRVFIFGLSRLRHCSTTRIFSLICKTTTTVFSLRLTVVFSEADCD